MFYADKTVTVYHKSWDAEAGVDTYQGTVLQNVSFFSRVSTNVSTDGFVAACEGILRIPMEVYPESLEMKNGDYICAGALQTEGMQPSDLDRLCPYVFTIVGITRNTSGYEPHVKVVCK